MNKKRQQHNGKWWANNIFFELLSIKCFSKRLLKKNYKPKQNKNIFNDVFTISYFVAFSSRWMQRSLRCCCYPLPSIAFWISFRSKHSKFIHSLLFREFFLFLCIGLLFMSAFLSRSTHKERKRRAFHAFFAFVTQTHARCRFIVYLPTSARLLFSHLISFFFSIIKSLMNYQLSITISIVWLPQARVAVRLFNRVFKFASCSLSTYIVAQLNY